MKRCLQCGVDITGHPNKKFCSNKGPDNCKDLYHAIYGNIDVEADEYLDDRYEDEDTWYVEGGTDE
jgi:hypothetical protein